MFIPYSSDHICWDYCREKSEVIVNITYKDQTNGKMINYNMTYAIMQEIVLTVIVYQVVLLKSSGISFARTPVAVIFVNLASCHCSRFVLFHRRFHISHHSINGGSPTRAVSVIHPGKILDDTE